MNGLGGNHSPLVRLKAQPLKHTPREKYAEDGGQDEGEQDNRVTKMVNKRILLTLHMYIHSSQFNPLCLKLFFKLLSAPAAMDIN